MIYEDIELTPFVNQEEGETEGGEGTEGGEETPETPAEGGEETPSEE